MSKVVQTVNLHCSAPKCEDCLQLTMTSTHAYGLEGGHVTAALELAGAQLGWRRDITPIGPLYRDRGDLQQTHRVLCPKHAARLVCARCGAPTHGCSCMGGPRFDAREE